MRKITKLFTLAIALFMVSIFTTGCTTDNMDGIEIVVTNYPNEYITKRLYGDHSTITSIYPDGVDTDNYKISSKQKNEYAYKDLFVYNGLIEKERDLAVDLLDINPDLKIIDTAYVLETDYSPEELWLNPSSLLMMAQNIRLGLEEYVDSTYLKKDIDSSYESLKVKLSELDADYRVAVENTDNRTIVVADSALKYLENFGLEVICIDADASDKTISQVEDLIDDEEISYIYTFTGEKISDKAKSIIDEHSNVKKLELHKLDNITDNERTNSLTYLTIMNNNLDLIKQELYQ